MIERMRDSWIAQVDHRTRSIAHGVGGRSSRVSPYGVGATAHLSALHFVQSRLIVRPGDARAAAAGSRIAAVAYEPERALPLSRNISSPGPPCLHQVWHCPSPPP